MSKFFATVLVFVSMIGAAFAQGGSADVGLVNAMQGDLRRIDELVARGSPVQAPQP